jgi:hypothetical protein
VADDDVVGALGVLEGCQRIARSLWEHRSAAGMTAAADITVSALSHAGYMRQMWGRSAS